MAGAIQKPAELARLLDLVRAHRPEVVVEVGTAAGGTFAAFCRVAAPDALLVSIDLPLYAWAAEEVELADQARAEQQVVVLRGDSHSEATRDRLLEALGGRPVDFLFIDGDHTYEGVKSDFELYAPLVRPGGIVAFHDVVPHSANVGCEVDRFWSEVRTGYRHEEFLARGRDVGIGPWGGIGVLHWEPAAGFEGSGPADGGEATRRDDALALGPGADHRHG